MTVNNPPTDKVIAYIDGFSVYYGLKSKGLKRLLWLDYRRLMERYLLEGQELSEVLYFTSRVRKPAESRDRQAVYLDALQAQGGLTIVEGKHEVRPVKCPSCEFKWDKPKEKMTDVALATRLVLDAVHDRFDTAFLVCADADLCPAVDAVQDLNKRVVVISPSGRRSLDLSSRASAALSFRRSWLVQSQLPDAVVEGGWAYHRPESWN